MKSTGKWTEEQNRLFQGALKKHGKNWKKIAKEVKTRTIAQIRSHAQKYIPKMLNTQNNQHLSRNLGDRRYSRRTNPAPPEYVPPIELVVQPTRSGGPKKQRIRRRILRGSNSRRLANSSPQRRPNQLQPHQQVAPRTRNQMIPNPDQIVEEPIERVQPQRIQIQVPAQTVPTARRQRVIFIIAPQYQRKKTKEGQ